MRGKTQHKSSLFAWTSAMWGAWRSVAYGNHVEQIPKAVNRSSICVGTTLTLHRRILWCLTAAHRQDASLMSYVARRAACLEPRLCKRRLCDEPTNRSSTSQTDCVRLHHRLSHEGHRRGSAGIEGSDADLVGQRRPCDDVEKSGLRRPRWTAGGGRHYRMILVVHATRLDYLAV